MSRARRAARFAAWQAAARTRLQRRAVVLQVEAPHGPPRADALPSLDVVGGHGPSILRLVLGRGASLGRAAVLEVDAREGGTLELGEGAYLQSGVRVALHGGRVALGARAHARDGCVLKAGRGAELLVGDDVTLSYGAVLAAATRITIGDRCGIGERVSMQDSDHAARAGAPWYLHEPLRADPIELGGNVWIGANAVLLRGTRIGANSVVAAGSVVRGGDHPAGHLMAGVPAGVRRPLPD